MPTVIPTRLDLPAGLVGFPEHRHAELFHLPGQLPFRWLRVSGPDLLHFVVIEPSGVVPDYTPELFDEDATSIGLATPGDALVLNIVTVSRTEPVTATVNLVGPLIVNRRTGVGRQVVLSNHNHYSPRHPIVTATP
ncbi:flagellar assembly protein FliW [Opitutaceae bacterium TAV4]|nr:flagellar assembly protein FliW [Opitutaceae bacterium TAV4]